jgi:predicted nucleotidyltransferase
MSGAAGRTTQPRRAWHSPPPISTLPATRATGQSGRVARGTTDDSLARRAADEIVATCAAVLGENALAIILHGSLATGDFIPATSDIDLLVVVGLPLPDSLTAELIDTVVALAQRRGVRLDLRVVTVATARAPDRQPRMELAIGLHPTVPGGVEIAREPVAEPDLLFEFSICRQHGVAKRGAEPREVIGSVPLRWMLDVGDGYLERWQHIDYDPHHADFMVFTACRLWCLHEEARHLSKPEAASRVHQQHPDLAAPHRAIERAASPHALPLTQDEVMAMLAAARAVLARPLPAGLPTSL